MHNKTHHSAAKTIANDDMLTSCSILHSISNCELYAMLEMRYGPAIAQQMMDDLIEFEQQKSVA